MRISKLIIQNFKSIEYMELTNLEQALILVGKNSTGKTAVLDALHAVAGEYKIEKKDFRNQHPAIQVHIDLEISKEDLKYFHQHGMVSKYRRFEVWQQDFEKKLPSYQNGILSFTYLQRFNGEIVYQDGYKKNNPWILTVFPQIYYLDSQRILTDFQKDLLLWMENDLIKQMRTNCCIFDSAKTCNQCFECIGYLEQKQVKELNAFETARLLNYKLYQLNIEEFSHRMNENFHRNGGREDIVYSMDCNMEHLLNIRTESFHKGQNFKQSIEHMPKGMRSVYMLSLMETYAQGEGSNPGIIIVEEPEIYLHPQMQKVAGEILYRLAKKNQVMFTTHSPHVITNFNSKQIRQIVLDDAGNSKVLPRTDIGRVLDDLGYSAADLMNVDFVFIVEGKQDKSRLPLLIRKYYSETYNQKEQLSRISIITTNSCTNIKTYANLKYINQLYLKDRFMIIRDGDGKDAVELKSQLCKYYADRSREETDTLPRVQEKNVLILKYYSFENYFLNPEIMAKVGVVSSADEFYKIFLRKWKEYLRNIRSGRHLREVLGKDLETIEDVKNHMEDIKIYMRGHNLYDIFYGRYKKKEQEILSKYIEIAPREEFKDILDSIDSFIYFENRKSSEI
ncbi:MAG: AAA family ATPase [Ruminococcus sp.]|nr:AAA family ATPase [Ruminococcus sp.]